MYFIYNLITWPAALLLLPWIAYRAMRGRLPGLRQRLGFLPPRTHLSDGPVLWVHAVSLGEVKAATPLLEELHARLPGLRLAMTSATRTGWEAASRLLQPGDMALFPPLDLSWICRRFLRQIRPNAVLVMETELWPSLFREVKRWGIPLALVNGRISDRAFPRYRASRFLWRRVLAQPDILFVQSQKDSERFLALGAPREKLRVAGNLKFCLRPATAPIVQVLRTLATEGGAEAILVAGSTMPGEESLLFETFRQLAKEFPRLWMIVAPRHPERSPAIAEEARRHGLSLQLRSQLSPAARFQLPAILLLDTTGELATIYELATVAFVGGTLVPTGGHNILEPAWFGRPIVIGPSMTNFQEIADACLQAGDFGRIPGLPQARLGAVVQIQESRDLLPALRFLLENPALCDRLGKSARGVLDKNTGGIHSILEEVEQMLCRATIAASGLAESSRREVVGAGRESRAAE